MKQHKVDQFLSSDSDYNVHGVDPDSKTLRLINSEGNEYFVNVNDLITLVGKLWGQYLDRDVHAILGED